jgi:hypothetical protein
MDYHADRFRDHSLMVLVDERLVALLPADERDSRLRSHGGLTFGGMVSDRRMSANLMLEIFDAVLAHLRAEGIAEWLYKPVPHIYWGVPGEEDLYALFRNQATLVRRDLSSSILLSDRLPYSKGRSSSIKRARNGGLDVGWSDAFEEFMELAARSLEARHGVAPTHSAEELRLLARRFPENIRLATARRAGQLLAGAVVYETPWVAHTQYIATADEGRDLSAADAVVDTLIAGYAAAKRWFDFGISTEQDGRHLNEGLVRNKESYGARSVAYDCWRLPVA